MPSGSLGLVEGSEAGTLSLSEVVRRSDWEKYRTYPAELLAGRDKPAEKVRADVRTSFALWTSGQIASPKHARRTAPALPVSSLE